MINKDIIQLNIRYCIEDEKNFNQNILTLFFLLVLLNHFHIRKFNI